MLTLRETLIHELEAARRDLSALVERAPTGLFIYPHWTIKEYIDHVSGWDDAMVEALEAHANDRPVPLSAARGINSYNAQTVATRESLDLVQSRLEFEASHEKVIQTMQNLPDEKFSQPLVFPWGEHGTVKDFIDIFIEHDREHAQHLEEWLVNPNEVIGEH